MGRHLDNAARPGVSRGLVVAVVVVVALGVAVFGWFKVRENVAAQGSAAANTCVSGLSTLVVAADPAIAPTLNALAERYSATKPIIRDNCVRVVVDPVADGPALAGLRGDWASTLPSAPPAVWVAETSSTINELVAARPALLTEPTPSIASSPLQLAVPATVAPAMTSSGLSWARLPELQNTPQGWARYGQPDWGTSHVALPTGPEGATTSQLTVQAVAAGISGITSLDPAVLGQPAVTAALARLRRGPTPPPASSAAALTALHGLPAVAGSPYQAVPALEQQVRSVSGQPGQTPLAGVTLSGPTPVANFPLAVLTAPWVDDTQSRAARAFSEFVIRQDQRTEFTAAGFRAADDRPAQPLPPVDGPTSAALTALLVPTR